MNKLQVKQTIDLINIAERAGAKFRKAGKIFQSACPLHGGDNPTAFTIYIGNDGLQHYKCFTRTDCNQYGSDVIAFVMKLDNVDFKTAYKTLTGENPELPRTPVTPRAKPSPKPITLPPAEWQIKALKLMDAASDRLLESDEGHAGREYLSRRGLSRAVWMAWQLGFLKAWDPKAKRNRPVIVIPWLDMDAKQTSYSRSNIGL